MKLLVIGASQGTGALAASLALTHGHRVTAFARNPQKLGLKHPQLIRVSGDFHDQHSVDAVMPGQQVVILTASSITLKGFRDIPDYFSRGTRHVIAAMKAHGARRLVILSALGVGDSYSLLNPLAKLFVKLVVSQAFADHALQEQMVRESGLEWVIARPSKLSNRAASRKSVKKDSLDSVPASIARADVAAFLVEAAESDKWLNKVVHLGG